MTDRLILAGFRLFVGLLLLFLSIGCFLSTDDQGKGLQSVRADSWSLILFAGSQIWLARALRSEAWRPLWPRDPNETAVE